MACPNLDHGRVLLVRELGLAHQWLCDGVEVAKSLGDGVDLGFLGRASCCTSRPRSCSLAFTDARWVRLVSGKCAPTAFDYNSNK